VLLRILDVEKRLVAARILVHSGECNNAYMEGRAKIEIVLGNWVAQILNGILPARHNFIREAVD
jgi:hypothetical protein